MQLRTLACISFTLAFGVIVVGCISANPAPDIAQTAALADDRKGIGGSLEDLWSKPWREQTGTWNGTSALGVDVAVQQALSNDPALRRNLAEVAAARANLSQASLPPNPVVQMAFGAAIDGMAGAPLFVQMIQQLTWLWTLSDRMDEGDALLEAAIFEAAHRVVTTAARVRIAFSRTMCMERLIELNAAYVKTSALTQQKIERLERQGGVSSVDLERARMDASRARADHANAIRMYRSQQLELLRLMGRPELGTDWSMSGNLAATLGFPPPDEGEVELRAKTVRLDLAAAGKASTAAEARSRLAGWARFPEVTLSTGYKQNFGGREAWMMGGAVSIPVLDDGSAKIARADAQQNWANLSMDVLRQEAVTEARTALNEWLRGREQLRMYREDLVPPAKKVVQSLLARKETGEAFVNDLLMSQRRMISLERMMVKQMLTGAIAWIKLETAVGGSLQLPLEAPEVVTRHR
ncbi:TolC family protein [Myxococcota bacterium]|nr:TolC family protein [Myxococcota bacterium]